MARRHPILRGIAILAGMALALLLLSAIGLGGLDGFHLGNAVAVVELRGVISDTADLVENLDRLRQRDGTVAVVLRIDSPGGGVAPSQELYDAVLRLRAEKPVIASLGNVAASGAYYVAAASDVIVADPGTLTGSIGAIMEFQNYQGLADKVGVTESVVKSGTYKDIGHPLRPLTADERRLLQDMVDDVLGQFVDAVAKGRNLPTERVRAIADGRLYSGRQAAGVGLVDRLGGLDDAVRLAWERGGQQGEPRVERVHPRRSWWQAIVGELRGELGLGPSGLGGGLLLLYAGSPPH